MNYRFKKLDALIVVILIIASVVFLYRAGYIDPTPPDDDEQIPDEDNVSMLPPPPTPPTSFIPSYRREVSPEDEGVHFDRIRICREWWYYSATITKGELKDWTVMVSFNHMARGDLLGTTKPDLLLVSLFDPDGNVYGGMINKKRGLGFLRSGTLIASSPGVNVEFENSWAEGEYPNWHVHAEDADIDKGNEIIIDLDFTAHNLPIWTIGNRAFDQSKSTIANYLFEACTIEGTITVNDKTYDVEGTGHHEHSWTPNIITKGAINGWDWFHLQLDNGWHLYSSTYYPTPQIISSKTSRLNPFSTVLITTENGEDVVELRNVDLKITKEDENIFPFVKMPTDYNLKARPSINPIYAISQSFLYGTNMELEVDIEVEHDYDKVWKFPTYMGMKLGQCTVTGVFSWSDDDGDHEIAIDGIGSSWSMRALL